MAKLNSQSGGIPNDGTSELPGEANGEIEDEQPGDAEGETPNGSKKTGDEGENSGAPGGNEVPEVADPVLQRPLLPIPDIDMIEAGAWQAPEAPDDHSGTVPPLTEPVKKRGLLADVDWRKYRA